MDIHEPPSAIPSQRGNMLLGIGLALLLSSAAFFSGIAIGTNRSDDVVLEAGLFSLFAADKQADGTDLSEFWRVWHLLENKFVTGSSTQSLSSEDRIEGAIEGLVRSYDDPYTIYLPTDKATQFEEDISGNFGGIGMEVGMKDDVITVIAPLPETPAERAGIVAGDKVVAIDGVSTDGMSIDEAVQHIRGPADTTVALSLYREGMTEFKEIEVTRETITIPTIKTAQKGDVFIITLYNFNALSEMKMQQALREFKRSGDTKLVLDLRGNPGGFLQSAVNIASYFLPAGKVVVREHFGDGIEEQVYRSQGKVIGDFNPETMVLLIDGGSASASEILAGALKEHQVATTIGETTFGKGSVQELVELDSGASLKVTVARWLTPEGVSFSDGGLVPNISIERTPEQIIADEDPQLEAALRWLSGDHAIASSEATTTVLDR